VRLFERLGEEYEEIVLFHDAPSGLRAVVAIHSTALGPALGGTRFYPYRSEDDAVEDVLRLARGMTLKSAAAGLDLGGGKAVIIGDPAVSKTETLLRLYGRFLDGLGGRYITAEDVGTTQADMDLVFKETANVTGVSQSLGGSGDPSAATAYGLWWAIKAVLEHRTGSADLGGRHVVVSGVGKVGTALVRHLVEDRATVTVADVDDAAVARVARDFDVAAAPVRDAHMVACDVFAPCALGAVLDDRTIPELRCMAVAGSANNQLAEASDAERLADRGITYAPDFVVNAGGVINIAEELIGYHQERAYANVRRIYDTTRAVLAEANRRGVTPDAAATDRALRRIREVRRLAGLRTFDSRSRFGRPAPRR
jgi:glutamate dehydrogenase/leucine dehydrogenase